VGGGGGGGGEKSNVNGGGQLKEGDGHWRTISRSNGHYDLVLLFYVSRL
jgi:hypothetical protein